MNTVRKHLSRVKGGRLAQAFTGKALFSLIVSDVIGDPLDVIASGPTVADPSTFAQALEVLGHFKLLDRIPTSVRDHLERGLRGEVPETPKELPGHVHNLILANNARSLQAAQRKAEELGYRVLNLGSFIEGETRQVAIALAGIARSILSDHVPLAPPVCLLSGGETTVTLEPGHGKGGRNQEFALAAGLHLLAASGPGDLDRWVVLSGGTDGEDGPTDAAGAIADANNLAVFALHPVDPWDHLRRHDAYPYFHHSGGLIQTGLTHTNVMDVRIILLRPGAVFSHVPRGRL
jgi:glycerate 2-kinase